MSLGCRSGNGSLAAASRAGLLHAWSGWCTACGLILRVSNEALRGSRGAVSTGVNRHPLIPILDKYRNRQIEELLLRSIQRHSDGYYCVEEIIRIAGDREQTCDVLLWYFSHNRNYSVQRELSASECTQIRRWAVEVLIRMGDRAIDAILKECSSRSYSIENTGSDQYANALSCIGQRAIPKIVESLLRDLEWQKGRPWITSDPFPNRIDCATEALARLGRPAIFALIDVMRAVDRDASPTTNDQIKKEAFQVAGVLAKMASVEINKCVEVLSDSLIERLRFLIRALGIQPTVEFLERIGESAIPCLVQMFYDVQDVPGRIILANHFVDALVRLKATGKRVALLYLEALTSNNCSSVAAEATIGFQYVSEKDRIQAVMAFGERHDLSHRHHLQSVLSEHGLLQHLRVGSFPPIDD